MYTILGSSPKWDQWPDTNFGGKSPHVSIIYGVIFYLLVEQVEFRYRFTFVSHIIQINYDSGSTRITRIKYL